MDGPEKLAISFWAETPFAKPQIMLQNMYRNYENFFFNRIYSLFSNYAIRLA